MKLFISCVFAIFIPWFSNAAESMSLYAQGCLPYSSSAEEGSVNLYFNCSEEYHFNLDLAEVDGNPARLSGEWYKEVSLAGGNLIVSVSAEIVEFPDGSKNCLISGVLKKSDGTKISAVTKNCLSEDFVSLVSFQSYGTMNGFPHLFFGNQEAKKANEKAIIKKPLETLLKKERVYYEKGI